jgi:response regulator RpfG family c-di-GMP phosphodiesterase
MGEKRLVAYNSIEKCNWFIVSTIPYTYIQEESNKLAWSIVYIALLCFIFAIPMSFAISFSISKPLSKLKSIMNEVKMGNIDIELIDNNNDEIAEISTGFNDMISAIRDLIKENTDTQKEIIYKLGAVTEARSQETGNHIRRVAHYSKLIALKYGASEEEANILEIASTLHDVGKVAIPDSILLKPGKLTEEEFEIMKTHTVIGYEILSNSNKPILEIASQIALHHHERYDGTGYPRALKGEQIEIYSRIVALTDVFDALATDRVYKKKWEIDKIVEYIKEQSGKQFDPKIVNIFLNNIDEFKNIQNKLRD